MHLGAQPRPRPQCQGDGQAQRGCDQAVPAQHIPQAVRAAVAASVTASALCPSQPASARALDSRRAGGGRCGGLRASLPGGRAPRGGRDGVRVEEQAHTRGRLAGVQRVPGPAEVRVVHLRAALTDDHEPSTALTGEHARL
jgi:hypothetical protein